MRIGWFPAIFLVALGGLPLLAQLAPVQDGFEEGAVGSPPQGWFVPTRGYRAVIVDRDPARGKHCVHLARTGASTSTPGPGAAQPSMGNVMRVLDAGPYRGKTIRLRAAVRVEGLEAGGAARLWFRVDRTDGKRGFFDNMGPHPIRKTRWNTYEIVGDVDHQARTINFGLLLIQGRDAWLDEVELTVVGETRPPEGPRPLTGRGLANLVAFTRLLGIVRFFHPGDEAAATDWDALAVEAMARVEAAADARALATTLEAVFQPAAALVQVFPTTERPPRLPPELSAPPKGASVQIVAWQHHGYGHHDAPPIYRSWRARHRPRGAGSRDTPRPDRPWMAELGGGVSCRVPLALYCLNGKSVPVRKSGVASGSRPARSYRAEDRSVRLAAVALAWNVFQHFYPYFDVVQTDWQTALRDALGAAASDPDEVAFLGTLRRLVARLEDGHGYVAHPGDPAQAPLPLALAWAEGHLVITAVDPEEASVRAAGLERGMVVRKIQDRTVANQVEALRPTLAAATPQHRRFRLLDALSRGAVDEAVRLEVEDAAGTRRIVTVNRIRRPAPREARPPEIHEIRPGIWYVDLDRVTTQEFNTAVDRLARARGIVFDMRGYPARLNTVVLAHLIDRPIQSPRWHVPVVKKPDRQGMTFLESRWPVAPQKPRFRARVAFVTDGRAISYAETYLGMVEHYHLGALVGEATAGTNGNVNPFSVPGGYRILWTGMKVLKHDGSRHHGVGIQPTVGVTRTVQGIREGRDELLEKAIQVVLGP